MSAEPVVSRTGVSSPEPLTVAPVSAPPVKPATETKTKAKRHRAAPAAPAPAPKGRRRAAGRTTRVVLRRLDPWSVLKLSLVYYLALFLVILVAGMLLWMAAESVGVVENIESFMVDIGFEDFRFIPSKLLTGTALGGLVLVVAGTVANVIMAALFNLMGDITGGLKLTLQEDGPAPARSTQARAGEGTATV